MFRTGNSLERSDTRRRGRTQPEHLQRISKLHPVAVGWHGPCPCSPRPTPRLLVATRGLLDQGSSRVNCLPDWPETECP